MENEIANKEELERREKLLRGCMDIQEKKPQKLDEKV